MKKELKIIILLSVFFAIIVNVYSQSYTLKPFKVKGDISKAFNSDNIKQELHKKLNIPSDYEFRAKDPKNIKTFKDEKDPLGFTHERLVQFYKGIKVENSDIRVHYKNDIMVSVNGEYANETNIDIIPILDEDYAIKKALEFVNAKIYEWEISVNNMGLQNLTNDKAASSFPNPELVLCKSRIDLNDSTMHIAYKMDISAIEPLSYSSIFVDAKDGTILKTNSFIKAIENAQTAYSGLQTISTVKCPPGNLPESDKYILKDDVRKIITKNLEGYSFINRAIEFIDDNNNWIEPGSINTVALDAHWGAMKTYDYFESNHGRNGYDNNGATLISYVHYGTSEGYPINNAYWEGGTKKYILYGDGIQYPLTCLDIVAHEYSHAICETTANLEYEGQSGAIDEGLSDIWAACVENYVGLGKNIWQLGEEIVDDDSICMRSMQNPNLKRQPDCMGGLYWVETNNCVPSEENDFCGVHANSGVMNYWFYLLVNGGESVNDLNHSYKTLPIGFDKAAQIIYRAENHYWTQGSTFDDARTYTIDAAIQLFGDYSQEVINVTNSWYAVGVGQSFSCIDVTYLSGVQYVGDTYILGCNFDLLEVEVEPNAKLTLDVVNEVFIDGPFEVKLSAQFEIK